MDWISFLLGVSIAAIIIAIISGAKKAYAIDKQNTLNREYEQKLNKNVRFDVDIIRSQISILFERIEKLEKKRR